MLASSSLSAYVRSSLIRMKSIAYRMEIILSEIVTENQNVIVQDRLISNNEFVASECFYYMKKKITWPKGIMTVKLDMSKACDEVE